MEKLKKKRLAVDIPEQMHKDIKEMADLRYTSITEWVKIALVSMLKWEKSHQ